MSPVDECQAKQAVWLYMRTHEKLKATGKEQLAFLKGHVHRLKLMKRQGYGRAAFSLLHKRVLTSH